jgi:hypothetical protein
MKTPPNETPRRRAPALAVTAFALTALTLMGAEADEPDHAAGTNTAATAEASAKPKRRALDSAPPSQEKSAAPTADEWKSAEPVALLGTLPDKCSVWLVREWLRIACYENGLAVSIISGSKEDVSATLVPLAFRKVPFEVVGGSSVLQLPIRRGDRRLLQVTTNSYEDYDGGIYPRMLFLLSVQWLDDQDGPWVAVARQP